MSTTPSLKLSEGEFAGYYGKPDPLTERPEWTVYRTSSGTLVAYRVVRKKQEELIERVVTEATNMVELSRYLDKPRKPRSKHKKPVQLTID